jgi:hypothetical protein
MFFLLPILVALQPLERLCAKEGKFLRKVKSDALEMAEKQRFGMTNG